MALQSVKYRKNELIAYSKIIFIVYCLACTENITTNEDEQTVEYSVFLEY